MKKTELKIGNYYKHEGVYHKGVHRTYKLKEGKGVVKLDQSMLLIALSKGINEYSSIELSEEWMLKLGYVPKSQDMEDNKIFVKDLLEVAKDCFSGVFCIDANIVTPDKIEYVHQLQNIHSVLTGVELYIN